MKLHQISPVILLLASAALLSSCDGGEDVITSEIGYVASSVCGNGHLDIVEACDGTLFSSRIVVNCGEGTHYDASKLKCSDRCELDTSEACVADYCGDGLITGNEECDPALGTSSRVKFMCQNPDLSKLKCDACRLVDDGVCAGSPAPVENACGNGKLDEGEMCDGGVFIDGARTCPDGRMELDNPVYRCLSSCRGVDFSQACADNACGNGKLDEGEQCDGSLFDRVAISSFTCGEGEMVVESALGCTEDCTINANDACYDNRFVLFSEVIPSLENTGNALYLGGLALELTNTGTSDAQLDSCGLFMTNAAGTSDKTWPFSTLGLAKIDAGDSVVVCIQKAGESNFGSACDYRIDESSLKTIFADKDLLAIRCGDKMLDIFNLNSFTAGIQAGGIDFIRHCDALPVQVPEKALLGEDWTIDPESADAPAYGLGEHCIGAGNVITSCTYTVSGYTLTDRSQMIGLTLDLRIPGITDVTSKTDASSGVRVKFQTGDFASDGTLSPQIHHSPEAFADETWTNDNGIDRYVGSYHNWDVYEGFISGEEGTYTMDAGISLDNGLTWTYCGPNGIIPNYEVYRPSERNTLEVRYEASTCGDGIISGVEVCDGNEFLHELYCTDPTQVPATVTTARCYSCTMASVEATCTALPETCGNGILDAGAGEICDAGLYNDDLLAQRCKADQTYIAGRAACNYACDADSSASCINSQYRVVFEELMFPQTSSEHPELAVAIRNNGGTIAGSECNFAILNSTGNLMTYASIGELAGDIEKDIDHCGSVVLCSQPAWDRNYTRVFPDSMCDATFAIPVVDGETVTDYRTILELEDARFLQITCAGNYIDYVDLKGVRDAAGAGNMHAILGNDHNPWPTYKYIDFSSRMTVDATADTSAFGQSTCQ